MILRMLCVLFMSLLITAESCAQTVIEMFVDQPVAIPSIPNTNVVVYDLSKVHRLESNLPRFAADPATSKTLAKKWIASDVGQAHIRSLQDAYRGHEQMVKYSLQKIPAIIFEQGKYAIYGTTDLSLAVREYDAFLKQLQKETHNAQ